MEYLWKRAMDLSTTCTIRTLMRAFWEAYLSVQNKFSYRCSSSEIRIKVFEMQDVRGAAVRLLHYKDV